MFYSSYLNACSIFRAIYFPFRGKCHFSFFDAHPMISHLGTWTYSVISKGLINALLIGHLGILLSFVSELYKPDLYTLFSFLAFFIYNFLISSRKTF